MVLPWTKSQYSPLSCRWMRLFLKSAYQKLYQKLLCFWTPWGKWTCTENTLAGVHQSQIIGQCWWEVFLFNPHPIYSRGVRTFFNSQSSFGFYLSANNREWILHLQIQLCPLEASTTVRLHINLLRTVLNLCLFYYFGILIMFPHRHTKYDIVIS